MLDHIVLKWMTALKHHTVVQQNEQIFKLG